MALRQALTKAILPNFERDLTQIMKREMKDIGPMLDAMMTPQCYGYSAAAGRSAGAFQASGLLKSPTSRMVKVNYPMKQHGLFH